MVVVIKVITRNFTFLVRRAKAFYRRLVGENDKGGVNFDVTLKFSDSKEPIFPFGCFLTSVRFADVTSFQTFFNYSEMRTLMSNFCVYHVNAPGQEEGAAPLSDE